MNITEVKCPSHALTGLITDGVNLDRLARKCLPRFSPIELLSPPFCPLLFGSKSLSPAHTQGEGMELSSTSWSGKCPHNIVWNSSVWKICLFSPHPAPIIYSVIYLLQYGLFYLYYTVGYNLVLRYCSDCSSFGWSSFSLAAVFL